MARLCLEDCSIQLAAEPADINSTGITGDYGNFAKYRRCLVVLLMGDGTANYDIDLTLYQATSNAGAGAKALNALVTGRIWTRYAASFATLAALTTAWTKVTQATADEVYEDSTNGEAVGITCLELRDTDLDATNGFTHFRCDASDPGASKIAALFYLWLDPRYPNDPTMAPVPSV